MDIEKPSKRKLSMNPELSIFSKTRVNSGIQQVKWVDCDPVNPITQDGDCEIILPGAGIGYIDFLRTFLYVTFKIVKADGTNLTSADKVAPINMILHTMWSQFDIEFQQKMISTAGTNYAYLSLFKSILKFGSNTKLSKLQSALYYKDESSGISASNPDPSKSDLSAVRNSGLHARYKICKESNLVDVMGVPLADIFDLQKYVLNGVNVKIKLAQSKNAFRLMTNHSTEQYKLILKQVSIRACKVFLAPETIKAHNETLLENPSIYPYMQEIIKTYNVSSGSYSLKIDDMFQGSGPSKLVCGLIKSEAYSGSYGLNPLELQSCSIDMITCYIDGQSLPFNSIHCNFSAGNYQEAYYALVDAVNSEGTDITREDFPKGYSVFVFNLDGHLQCNNPFPALRKANVTLEIKFSVALPWAATLICYATFPREIHIDKARAVLT